MHRFNPRRSACDRCRGHKLRCIRLDPGPNDTGALLPCKRCVKAGAECIHTANLSVKPPGDGHHSAHRATESPGHPAAFQQETRVSDRQLRESSLGISPTQPAPQRQTQRWSSSSGPHRPEDRESLPPWHMFATPMFSRQQLGFSKLPSHANGPPDDRTADGFEVGSEAALAAPPGSERSPHRTSRAPSDGTTTFSLVDKVFDLDGRAVCPLSGSVLQENAGIVTAAASTTVTSAQTHHMLPFSQVEPLTPSSYFNVPTCSTLTTGGAGSQSLRDQQMQQHQRHGSASGRSSAATQDSCLQLLSQLSSKFLMDFGKSSAGDWSKMANNNTNNHLSTTISNLFDGLQIFLKTIECLRPATFLENSSSDSECSYSDLCDESEFVGSTGDNQMQVYPGAMAVDHAHEGSSTENSAHRRGRGASPTADAAPQPLDMPMTLTILTCYTWLLKGYEVVLSEIYQMLASQDRHQGLQTLPTIVQGVGIGGFKLEDHPDMQIEIVIHVGWQLLQRIEGLLGVRVVSDEGRGGLGGSSRDESSTEGGDGGGAGSSASDERRILDPRAAAAVLDSWFTTTTRGGSGGSGPGEGTGDSNGGRTVEIKGTIANIRKYLRSYGRN
ncbi:hypothetical protein PgNI_10625 [Pyricularia grisea]|uniref:Pyrichalasin H cluster regulator pyiR n=2 Tax=Pyricularia grisea TaxID=148305 RepID=PYIR_PYRGI|nr:hypothetical protein PgNI_10625 [Pyricularia grisea]A0A4P8W7L7.1 RecName: Full=Pyrichalasin H cluster regulator pyiR; AltName: Full=Pyrichalasin H biosynthesis cluster protein R [Pyricularia grisea]QCS37518.1 PyiR [Pyricularia grisea]TLD07675.1 hypothetical protein PgNI_10625 [Pyricularia grisea]